MFHKITSLFKNQQGGIHSRIIRNNYQKLTSLCLMFLLLFQVIGGVFLFDLSSNTAQAAYLALTPNSDIVESAGYPAITSGGSNWPGIVSTEWHLLSVNNELRIRQNGIIDHLSLNLDSITNVNHFYIEIWRKNIDGTFNRIYQEDFVSSLQTGTHNYTPSAPWSVLEGDYIGYGYSASVATYHIGTKVVLGNTSTYFVYGSAPASTNYTWPNTSTSALVVKAYMQAPKMVFVGDSLTSGYPANQSFIEDSITSNPSSSIAYQLSLIYPSTYQNMGIISQETPTIVGRFTSDVVNLHPRIAVLEGGTNDLRHSPGQTKSTFLANWTTMLNACQLNGIIPVVMLIYPATSMTDLQAQTRDDWNASLQGLASGYPNAIVVNSDAYVGQFRSGGTSGNLWNIQPAYDADNLHYNQAGYAKIAQAIADALVESTDHLTITGSTSQTAGTTQTLTLSAYNNFGDIHTAYTGDKIITFSGASTIGAHHPTFIDKSGNEVNFGSSGTIAFTNGVATVNVSLYKDEIAEIDATDGTNSTSGDASYDLNVVVSPNIVNSFNITSPSAITSETPFSLSLTSKDSSGNTTTSVTDPTTLSVDYGRIGISSIPNTEFQDDGVYTNNITISEIYADRNIVLTIRNGSIAQNVNLSVTGVSHGTGFIPPTKPIVTPTDPTLGTVPSNITQIAISRTPDFTNISWQPFDKDKFKNIDQTTETLYVKFRTDQGAVSDTIIYEAKPSIINSNPTTQTLIEGDIVKTPNNPDVYVIKYKNNKQYKRLILSPLVFKSYGHLKWENIKIVSQEQLDKYTTSNLVKETIDTIIYQLFPNGDIGERKAQDTSINYDSDSVYEINAVDRDSYKLIK